jgi:hypothetical protein
MPSGDVRYSAAMGGHVATGAPDPSSPIYESTA